MLCSVCQDSGICAHGSYRLTLEPADGMNFELVCEEASRERARRQTRHHDRMWLPNQNLPSGVH